VIVNQTLAKKYFPDEDPIGKQIGDTALTPKSIKTIIGVIEDIKEGALDSDIWPADIILLTRSRHLLCPGCSHIATAESVLTALDRAIHQVHPDVDQLASQPWRAHQQLDDRYLHRSSAWVVEDLLRWRCY